MNRNVQNLKRPFTIWQFGTSKKIEVSSKKLFKRKICKLPGREEIVLSRVKLLVKESEERQHPSEEISDSLSLG